MKQTTISILLAVLFCGCAVFKGGMKISSEDQKYLTSAYDARLEFSVVANKSDTCWSRAREWIEKYSSKKIQTANDFMIQTYNPSGEEVAFGYYVTKKSAGENVQFSVQCIVGNLYAKKDQENNAHLLAYYIQTGKVVPKLIVKE
jgi:hypothetical protein